MLKDLLFTFWGSLLLVACSTNDKYDSSVCQDFINKYSYEGAFNSYNSAEYDESLRHISQKEFSEMIGQLKGILAIAYTELTNISVLESRSEMKEQYEQFNDKIMLQHYKFLYGIVDDAEYRGLLDSDNKKSWEELQPIKEDVASADNQIMQMIR